MYKFDFACRATGYIPDTMKPQCKKDTLSQVFVFIAKSQHKINLPQLSLLTGFLNKERAYTSAITANSGRCNLLAFCSNLASY